LVERQPVLLLPLQGELADLSGRLLLVHFRGRAASTVPEAERMVRDESPPIRVGVIPSDPRTPELVDVLRRLRDVARSGGLRFVAVGPRPGDATRTLLRAAGVEFALYGEFGDTELRFVLNHAANASPKGERREQRRVPTSLNAKLGTPMGTKVALVYNLSARGAYLETLRPSQAGARLTVELPLPGGTLVLPAVVVSTNVTGNLRRENLPRGMAVRFDDPTSDQAAALARYIEERAAAYRP
jgi:hypothetical protein